MRFSDFRAGDVVPAGKMRVTLEDIVEFARQYDPQPFHVDPQWAADSRWKGVIASGWHTCAIAMRLLVESVLRDSDSIGSPGIEALKWPAPVRPGDELEMRVVVLELERSSSGGTGIVRWRWLLTNQSGATVLDLVATSLFALRP